MKLRENNINNETDISEERKKLRKWEMKYVRREAKYNDSVVIINTIW